MVIKTKQFVRLLGSYSILARATVLDLMLLITGGVNEEIRTHSAPSDLFLDIKLSLEANGLIVAGTHLNIDKDPKNLSDKNLTYFVVTDTTVVNLREVVGDAQTIEYVRLSHPHAKIDFNAHWTEASRDWYRLPESLRSSKKMETKKFGDFYMPFSNFIGAFKVIYRTNICDGSALNCEGYFTSWTPPRFPHVIGKLEEIPFHKFPQFKWKVRNPRAQDNQPVQTLISLMEGKLCANPGIPPTVCNHMFLFKLHDEIEYKVPIEFQYFRFNKPIFWKSSGAVNESTTRLSLAPGRYLIVIVIDTQKKPANCQNFDYILRLVTPGTGWKARGERQVLFYNSVDMNVDLENREKLEEPISSDDDMVSSTQSRPSKSSPREKTKQKKKKVKG